jgi:hypothetical protein
MAEWWNGGMAEWRNDGMTEWRNGGMAEWRNGGMAEWQSGIMYSTKYYGIKIWKVHRCLLGKPPLGLSNDINIRKKINFGKISTNYVSVLTVWTPKRKRSLTEQIFNFIYLGTKFILPHNIEKMSNLHAHVCCNNLITITINWIKIAQSSLMFSITLIYSLLFWVVHGIVKY